MPLRSVRASTSGVKEAAGRPLLLVTGAGGRVGTALRPHLTRTHDLRLLDLVAVTEPRAGETVMVGDLADPEVVAAAVSGVDAVLHLACVHGLGLRFSNSIDANITGTVNLLEAVQSHGVARLVYASSHHVLGLHPSAGFAHDDAELAPDAYYGLGKAFGELACKMFATRYGLKTLVIRIGNADPAVPDARSLRMWTSARDLAQLVLIGLEHPEIAFDIVYGASNCPAPLFPNERATALGYRPQDDARENLAADYLPFEEMPPERGRDFVGGAYAVADLPWGDEQA